MSKIVLKSEISNDKYTEFIYSNYDIQNKEITTSEIPFPKQDDLDKVFSSNWNILLICGNSGSGKSTILKRIGASKMREYDPTKACISQFPWLTEEEVCDLFCGVGLASVPTWLRKPQELSNGERARLDLCNLIASNIDAPFICIDEFTSVVNRDVAKSMSHSLQRYLRQNNKKAVIASCHFDIVGWLKPDYVYNLNKKDSDGEVDMEHLIYKDETEYNQYQSINLEDVLSEAMEVKEQ